SWETFKVSITNSTPNGVVSLQMAKGSVLNEKMRKKAQDDGGYDNHFGYGKWKLTKAQKDMLPGLKNAKLEKSSHCMAGSTWIILAHHELLAQESRPG
ncbi:hypothetical protein CR513_34956, partial [Mucuna pruriens]